MSTTAGAVTSTSLSMVLVLNNRCACDCCCSSPCWRTGNSAGLETHCLVLSLAGVLPSALGLSFKNKSQINQDPAAMPASLSTNSPMAAAAPYSADAAANCIDQTKATGTEQIAQAMKSVVRM